MSLTDFDPDLSGELRAVTGVAFGWEDDERQEQLEEALSEAALVGVCGIGCGGSSVGYGVLVLPASCASLVQISGGTLRTLSATEAGRLPWLLHTAYLSSDATRWGSASKDWARILPDLEAVAEDLGGDSDLGALGSTFGSPELRRLIDSGRGLQEPRTLLQLLDPSPEFAALTDYFLALKDGGPAVPGEELGAFRAGAALAGFAVARDTDEGAATEAARIALSTRAGLDHEVRWIHAVRLYGWALGPLDVTKDDAARWLAEHAPGDSPQDRALAAWADDSAYDGTAHAEAARALSSQNPAQALEHFASAAWFAARHGASAKAIADEVVTLAEGRGWSDIATLTRGL